MLGDNDSVGFALKGAVHEGTENEESEIKEDNETMMPLRVEHRQD